MQTDFISRFNRKKQNKSFMFNVDVVKTFRKFFKIFIEILMLIHFDSKNRIRIETNVYEFVIEIILS